MARLSKIFIYPIKALSGIEVEQAEITSGGILKNDRRWAMVDKKGKPINGKNNGKVYSLNASFDLTAEKVVFNTGETEQAGFDMDDPKPLEAFLSEQLGMQISLLENKQKGFPDDANAFGPTIISQASLIEVQSWFPHLSLAEIRARFRINLEVSGVPSFWEDGFFVFGQKAKTAKIGSAFIEAVNPCARCSVPTKSSKSGKRDAGFYETFIRQREAKITSWTDPACFDHWYRLSINTKIPASEAGKKISLKDKVEIV